MGKRVPGKLILGGALARLRPLQEQWAPQPGLPGDGRETPRIPIPSESLAPSDSMRQLFSLRKISREWTCIFSDTFPIPASGESWFMVTDQALNGTQVSMRHFGFCLKKKKSQEKDKASRMHFTKNGSTLLSLHIFLTLLIILDFLQTQFLSTSTLLSFREIFLPKSSMESSIWWNLNWLLHSYAM